MRYFLYKQSFITKEEIEFISLPYNLNKSQFVAVLDNLSEEEDCTVTMKIYNQKDELVQSFDNLLVQKFNDLYTDIFEMEPNYKLRVKVDDTSSDEIEVHFSLLMIISKDKPIPPKIKRPALFIVKEKNPPDAETGVELFWKRVQADVRNGTAREKYGIGHQFYTTWTDENEFTYDVPLNVVHYGEVELESGEKVPGMYLQWDRSIPYNMPFSNPHALYYTAEGLSPGMYYFHYIASSWPELKYYSFTLTKPVPAGGQILISGYNLVNYEQLWILSTYSRPTSDTPIEIVNSEFKQAGKHLFTWKSSTIVPFNNDFSVSGGRDFNKTTGHNRWAYSLIRQWLNSSEDVGKWWSPQLKFERPNRDYTDKTRGFMAGFKPGFLSVLRPIRVVTATNTVESLPSDRDITYDTFFIPSLEQEYIVSEKSGVEGEVWDYWKMVKNISSPQLWYKDVYQGMPYNNAYRYNIKTKTTESIFLRSAVLSKVDYIWRIDSIGRVDNIFNLADYYYTPVCVIC